MIRFVRDVTTETFDRSRPPPLPRPTVCAHHLAPQKARAKFVEVQPSNLASQKACVVELHSAGDLKLRVEFNTFDAAGLATFVQQVLGAQN